ncbi:hypothetical protein DL771_005420 [Monosporascus sp. 5C6A]|nr:hypothetical protein DL771_005420 [Monosporascus sp. 5C6A]
MAGDADAELGKSFKWLRRGAREPTYISYSEFSDRTPCSFEFGADGFAASCNHGGELLHMSTRSEENGIIFARGDFEDSMYSALARAQRMSGGKSTFGLKVAADQRPFDAAGGEKGSTFALGPIVETGSFNYRWPFHESVLAFNGDLPEHIADETRLKEMGTCVLVSFIKDGVLYQVLQIEEGCRGEAETCYIFPTDAQIVLAVGGPIQFQVLGSDPEDGQVVKSIGEALAYFPEEGSKFSARLGVQVYQVNSNGGYEALDLEPAPDEADRFDTRSSKARSYLGFARIKGKPSNDRFATFLAAFRLQDAEGDNPWPETPTSEDIYDYIGIKSTSPHATGAMWDTIFLRREAMTSSYSGLSEFKLVGRCLEKVLQVDLVPAAFGEKGKRSYEKNGPLALISNLFLQPNVDLEALFKAPSSVKPKSRAADTALYYHEIMAAHDSAKFQMARIRSCVERIMTYLVEALLKPRTKTAMLPDEIFTVEPNYYYVMFTLWYVVGKCPDFTWSWVGEMNHWPEERGLLAIENHLPADNANFRSEDKDKVTLLKWYHYASVLELCHSGKIPKIWQDKGLHRKVYLLKQAARRAAAVKLSSHRPYLPDDEIVDRLSFLTQPLGLGGCEDPTVTITSLSVQRIQERDFTRELNPGLRPNGDEGPTSGPWEIHALCHHSELLIANYQYKKKDGRTRAEKAEEVENFRRRFATFLTTEGGVVACWERRNLAAHRGWLRSEATSVLASTLLGICQKDLDLALEEEGTTKGLGVDLSGHLTIPAPSKAPEFEEKSYRIGALKQELPLVEWTNYRPARYYHPESFFNSLDDTPKLYRHPFTARVSIPPAVRSRVAMPYEVGYDRMDQSLQKLETWFKPPDLDKESVKEALRNSVISVIDLKVTEPILKNSSEGRYRMALAGPVALALPDDAYGPGIYIEDGERIDHEFDEKDRATLGQVLTDSLVDQHVQHRIIHFVYVFHPESADGFSNHISRFSDFSSETRGTWVSHITLRCWSLTRTDEGPEMAKSKERSPFKELRNIDSQNKEDLPIKLPDGLKTALKTINVAVSESENASPSVIKLEVSSIVLSTNMLGDFSKCTIITKHFSRKELKWLAQKSEELWQTFVHQPQTGRCLVFMHILGFLCQKIAREFDKTMEYFVETLKLDDFMRFDFDDDWLSGPESLARLQLGLWSLESLYMLRNSLTPSINSIEQAKTQLVEQINEGPGKRGDTLERICQEAVNSFGRNLGLLESLNSKLDEKIELNSRYKDALSTMLSLSDSRNSITQNSTIQKLTYLTIGYLPIGLAAGGFAELSKEFDGRGGHGPIRPDRVVLAVPVPRLIPKRPLSSTAGGNRPPEGV